jgi:hypothetical protein
MRTASRTDVSPSILAFPIQLMLLPIRVKLLTEIVDPRWTKSKIENPPYNLEAVRSAAPALMEKLLPMRAKLRTDNELPIWKKLNIDNVEPNLPKLRALKSSPTRQAPRIDTPDPILPKDLIEMLDDVCRKFNTEQLDESLLIDRRLSADPTLM